LQSCLFALYHQRIGITGAKELAMTTIAATNSTNYSAAASLLNSAAAGTNSDNQSQPANAGTISSLPGDPVDTVNLSDRAKATLARAKTDQVAAEKLTAQLQSMRDPNGKSGSASSKSTTDDASKLFDALSGRSTSQATSNTKWEAGSKYGDPTISDAAFLDSLKPTLMGYASGLAPDKQEAMIAAINNGTIKVQKASEVPDLNTHSTVTYSGAPGGLQGMGVYSDSHPTGVVKEAIDQGNALTMWSQNRGDVYFTW
jgi:hypothetical protein